MGVIILAADPGPFREGNYVEGTGIICPPTATNTTFIFHLTTVKPERDIERWLDVVGYRMVIITGKVPRLKDSIKEQVIVHRSLNKPSSNLNRECSAMMKWSSAQATEVICWRLA